MDRILINDLLVRCILGVTDEERRDKQDILINIELGTDLRRPAATDRIEDGVNYSELKKNIIKMVEQSEYHLVESLAERISEICLEHDLVKAARVRVEKPGALRFARSVAVEVSRGKENQK